MQRRALLFGLLVTACGKSRRPPPPLTWFDDVDLAYAEAKRMHRSVFLFFCATWDCGTKEYEHRTFPDPDVGALLHDGFVCVRVDCSDDEDERTRRLATTFDIKGVPTVIVTDSDRNDLWRESMYLPPEKLAVVLRAARARHDALRDVDAGLRLAAAWNRPVLLLFLPSYDHASSQLRRDCFGDRNVAGRLRDSFVVVDAPSDDGWNPDWARFGIRGSPTAIVVDGGRRVELARVEQLVDPRAFERFLDLGLARYRA